MADHHGRVARVPVLVSHTGLLADNTSIAVLTGWGAGTLLFLYGWHGWTWEPARTSRTR